METQLIAAALGTAGGLVAGSLMAWVTLKAKKLDHAVEDTKLRVSAFEKTLFEQRLADYRELWALTEQTSRRNIDSLIASTATKLAHELTCWYYRKGGILLTAEARNAFFIARECLDDFEQQKPWLVVQKFSVLRTALCDDLNSRQGPTFTADGDRRQQQRDATNDIDEIRFSRSISPHL